jgi:protein SCO1/2
MLTNLPRRNSMHVGQSARRAALPFVAAVAGALLLAPAPASALKDRPWPRPEDDNTLPKQEQGVRIDDRPGVQLPADVHFRDQEGRDVTLGSYFDGSRPVVLVLAYFTCPMLCTTVLNGMTNGLRDVAWNAGEAYRILTISIDPRDTPDMAKEKRANYVRSYGRVIKPDAWDFLTGDEASVKRVADAIGFHYKWDPEQQQYAHAAGAFIITPSGKVSRVFYGIQFDPKDLKLALVEASDGKFRSTVDQLLLFCFHYDPKVGKYVLAAQRVMTGGGVITVFALVLMVLLFFRNEKKVRAHA